MVLLREAPPGLQAAAFPSDDAAIVHVLNRLGYGARPGDVEKVRSVGLQSYMEQQLRPERIPDSAIDARLRPLSTLTMRSRELARSARM